MPLRWVLIRDPEGAFTPQALLSTHPEHTPEHMLTWCVRRWTIEVTFEDARAPLGMATQRPWHAQAIGRTTPVWLSLYAIITLTAQLLLQKGANCVRSTAWQPKTGPAFSEAIALVRRHVWDHSHFSTSQLDTNMAKIPQALLERLTEARC